MSEVLKNRSSIRAAVLGAAVIYLAYSLVPAAQAAGGPVKSPTGTAEDRYLYYPGTEELPADEMRVTACGTGMPAARHGQVATCWLVELGNGDKFLFDMGTGAMSNRNLSPLPSSTSQQVATWP